MTLLEKIQFLIKTTNYKEKDFCKLFKLSPSDYRGQIVCKEKFVNLINYFNLNFDDFFDGNFTLDSKDKKHKHCRLKSTEQNDTQLLYDDDIREDNARYEEKD